MKSAAKTSFILLALTLACVQASGPAACTVATYQDQGVAITYMKPSFTEVRRGSTIDLYVEYQNVGEAVAKNVRLYDRTSWSLGAIANVDAAADFTRKLIGGATRLAPPDPEKCIPGELKKPSVMQFKVGKDANIVKEGLPIDLALVYDYTTSAWADILTMTRDQWLVRREKDTMPQTFEWVSAAPVKVHFELPKTPIIDTSSFLVKLYFTNELGGCSYPTTDKDYLATTTTEDIVNAAYCYHGLEVAGQKVPVAMQSRNNCIFKVTITLPEGFHYAKADCDNCVPFATDNKNAKYVQDGQKLIIYGATISSTKDIQDKKPYEYYLQLARDTTPSLEETQKLKVDAEYTYHTKYSTVEKITLTK